MANRPPRAWVREADRSKKESRPRARKLWEVVYEDPDTRRRRTKGGFGNNKAAAKEWAEQFVADNRTGQAWVDPSKATPTFSALAASWFNGQHFDRAHTANGYRRIINGNNELMRTFGDTEVGEITPENVRHFVRDASAKLSAQSVRHQFYVLRWVLDQAVEDKLIRVNPARAIHRLRLPKQPKVDDHERKQRQAGRRLAPEQVDQLVEAMPEPYDMFIRLLAYSGMRPEEATGLTVADVNVDHPDVATLHVHAVVVEVNGKVIREEVTKTPESNRVIPLDPTTSRALSAYVADHKRRALRWFAEHTDHEHPGEALPLFVGLGVGGRTARPDIERLDFSKPMRYSAFYKRHWHKARVAAGIPEGVRVYDLRHTHLSVLLDNGWTLKDVQVRAGHKDGTMLMNRYWHSREQDADARRAAGAAVAAAFQRTRKPDNVTQLDNKRTG